MLDYVGEGFGARLGYVRSLTRGAIHGNRGPGPDDRDGIPGLLASRMAALCPLRSERLRPGQPASPTAPLNPLGSTFARMLGRDYAVNGRAVFQAIIEAGMGGPAAVDEDRWRGIGQAMLDASLGLPTDERFWSVPALPCDGIGGETTDPGLALAAHVDDLLAHSACDRGQMLILLGVSVDLAEILDGGDAPTFGGFVVGLLEGLSGRGWEAAASRAVRNGPCHAVDAFPLALAAHLAVQAGDDRIRFQLPGFGDVDPNVPEDSDCPGPDTPTET